MDGETAILTYSPLPEVTNELHIQCIGPIPKKEQEFREKLHSMTQTAALTYAVRPSKGQRTQADFPIYSVVPDLPTPGIRPEVALTLVERCFLMPEPEATIDAMSKLAKNLGCNFAGKADLLGIKLGERELVFISHTLINAIQKAFRRNMYGYRYAMFCGWDIMTGWPPFENPLYEILRPRKELVGPFFHFSAEELAGERNGIPRTEQKFEMYGISSTGRKTQRLPGYNSERTLLDAYRHLDADFLLRGIDDADWNTLMEEAEKWSTLRSPDPMEL